MHKMWNQNQVAKRFFLNIFAVAVANISAIWILQTNANVKGGMIGSQKYSVQSKHSIYSERHQDFLDILLGTWQLW
jgi:hypothetical protein